MRPSSGPKEPERLWAALLSLPPDALWPCCVTMLGRPGGCSCGVTELPIGVARCSVGRGGRPGAPPTGFTFGDGGIARPSLGVRAPAERAPGIAGLKSGAGLDRVGIVVAGGVGTSRLDMGFFIVKHSQC